MENVLFSNVKNLYDSELYESVIPTASLLETVLMNDRVMVATQDIEYHVLLYLSHANYYERNFRAASKQLEAAVLMRKTMWRHKNINLAAIESSYEEFNDVEMRYKIAVCHRELGDKNMAISMLQAVPVKSRTPKINMMLARLLHYGRGANKNEASIAYKEVLRECPMAMKAIEALIELGIDGNEVNSFVVNASAVPKNIEWLSTWIKAHAQMFTRRHLEAAKTFQQINDNTKFHQNGYLLTLIGKCLYYYGNFAQAEHYLETAVMLNPHNMEAVAPLAVVYECNQKKQEHDKLVAQLTSINDFNSDHWFVFAQSFYASAKFEKALSFTHKSLSMNPRNIEALLLRGKICLALARHKEAIAAFRTAQCLAPYRFEVYKGLFHCYVGLKRIKEAQTMCALAVRYFGNSPRSYTMFGRTLFHSSNPVAKRNAKKFVEKALVIDEHYAPAVALMAEVCQYEGETQEAIAMLKKQVINYPHPKLFTMLGDILRLEKDLSSALEYYTIALSMEPTCQRALDGVNALGQAARAVIKQGEQEGTLVPQMPPDEEWPIDCDEPSNEDVELSSPAAIQDDAESDTFSDPFWQDVDPEITN